MKVRDKLISALEGLGYPVALQGSYTVDEIPESCITYYIADSEDLAHYDNRPAKTGYTLNVNFYSRKMSLVNTAPELISDALLGAGFTREGPGQDGGLDKDTGHYGWLMDFYLTERTYNDGRKI